MAHVDSGMARRKAQYWTQSSAFHHEPGRSAVARRIHTMLIPSNHNRVLTHLSICHDCMVSPNQMPHIRTVSLLSTPRLLLVPVALEGPYPTKSLPRV